MTIDSKVSFVSYDLISYYVVFHLCEIVRLPYWDSNNCYDVTCYENKTINLTVISDFHYIQNLGSIAGSGHRGIQGLQKMNKHFNMF